MLSLGPQVSLIMKVDDEEEEILIRKGVFSDQNNFLADISYSFRCQFYTVASFCLAFWTTVFEIVYLRVHRV